MNNTLGTTELAINVFGGIAELLSPSDLPQGLSIDNLNCAFLPGNVRTRPPLRRAVSLPTSSPITHSASFTRADGELVEMHFTQDGTIWANGVALHQASAANPRFKTAVSFERCYIAISDGDHGTDVPLQYDGYHLDRISQDGPGAPPTFVPTVISTDQYPIATITQPAPQSWGYSYFLQSSGVGNDTTAGNNVTVYYSDLTVSPGLPDQDLVAAFQSGDPIYVYFSFTGAPQTIGPVTVLVTGVGTGQPPGQPRSFAYFTYTADSSALIYYAGSGHPNFVANYQRTMATVTMSQPVPDLAAGDSIAILDSSLPSWNSAWTAVRTLDSGVLNITETAIAGGTATYSYIVESGAPPRAGQGVTVTGTLNGNQALNVTNATIATSSGTGAGSFTITGFSVPDQAASAESAVAITSATQLTIDPGVLAVGSALSPIYGSATGGFLEFSGTQTTTAPGVRQAVVFFITRTGHTTRVSPVATFTVPGNSDAIRITNIPIGPPNVVARGIAFTAANGSRFFYLPVDPVINGEVNGTATVIHDNVTTQVTFNFADESLLNGIGIDVPGNDLFNQEILGPVLGMFPYQGRLFAWGERNKVEGLANMGFMGGTSTVAGTTPLGWSEIGSGTFVRQTPDTRYLLDPGSSLSQQVFQDSFGALLLTVGEWYSFRAYTEQTVTATLSSASTGFSTSATITADHAFGEADFDQAMPLTIPPDMTLTIIGTGAMGDLEIYDTRNPWRRTARVSYFENLEAFDGVTGQIGPEDDPHELRAFFVRMDTLYMLTHGPNGSLYWTTETQSGEPVTWPVSQKAAKCGAISVWGDARFEDWQVWASDTGLRIFDGGQVERMSTEIQGWWDRLLPEAKKYTQVANDPWQRRIYVGGVSDDLEIDQDSFPAGGLAWRVLDYRELNTAAAMSFSTPIGVGASGRMLTADLRRKWSPWVLPGINCVAEMHGELRLGGGNSYTLLEQNLSGVDDDYGWFPSFYFTYLMPSGDESAQMTATRKLYSFIRTNINGTGKLRINPVVNDELNPVRPTRALRLQAVTTYDLEFPIMLAADRASFGVEAVQDETGQGGFMLSGIVVSIGDHPYSPVRGWNKQSSAATVPASW
jgi:hypothetical protein